MQNLRIEDDPYNSTSMSIEELEAMNENNIATMLNSIEQLIGQQIKPIQNETEEGFISKYVPHPSKYSYPIKEKMFADMNHHARSCMYVNLHICPYQVNLTTNGTPFVQYLMLKTNDRNNKNLKNHQDNYMNFVNKTYFDHHTKYINFADEVNKMMRIIMLSYGKVVKENNIKYDGFIKRDNDFYVFMNISDSWINYHYLNMHDPLWFATLYEMTVLNEVCSVPVCDDVVRLFESNDFLNNLYHPDSEDTFPIPVTGFTIEDKKSEDMRLLCGTSSTDHRSLTDVFRYYYDYNDCCNSLREQGDLTVETVDELIKTKVVMRSHISYDKSVSYDVYETLSDEDKEKNILIVDYIEGNTTRGGFIINHHCAQTPINTHNIIL